MAQHTGEAVREAYLQWFSNLDASNAIALTVTFRRRSDGSALPPRVIDEATRVFCRILNTRAYGNAAKRRNKRVTIIPVLEGGWGQFDKHPHLHFFIQTPESWDVDAWAKAVQTVAAKIESFSASQIVIKRVRDSGWISYMMKPRDKGCIADSVDLSNMWICY